MTFAFVLRSVDDDKYSEDPEFKPAARHTKDMYEEVRPSSLWITSHQVWVLHDGQETTKLFSLAQLAKKYKRV